MKKLEKLFRRKFMKMLRQYGDDAKAKYKSSKNKQRKVEYKLLKRMYAKLEKFQNISITFRSWQKKAIPYFEKKIRNLVTKTYTYKMDFLNKGVDKAGKKFHGTRLANIKLLKVYKRLRKECKFVADLE